ncbi:MAG: hypothetical protein J0L75_19765 [Spirochaetes bacterium]|nr:hypothetical protein [Spirochaetota bacterium]
MKEKLAEMKPYLIAAAAGFLVSLVLVLAGDGGLGALLYKPLLSALVWGGLAFGVRQALRLLVPDLEKAIWPESPASSDSAPEAGEDSPSGATRGLNLNLSTGDDADEGAPSARTGLGLGSEKAAAPAGRGIFGSTPVISEAWVKPAETPAASLPPRKPDAAAQFDQDEKVLAKAVRSVMNQ